MTIIDEILERYESLQHLKTPPDLVALKAVTESLRKHGYVVITKSLYRDLSERPVRENSKETTDMMTRQYLERLGHKVRGTYRGPLDWKLCTGLYNDLRQCKGSDGVHVFAPGTLRIVRQDDGFNIVRVDD